MQSYTKEQPGNSNYPFWAAWYGACNHGRHIAGDNEGQGKVVQCSRQQLQAFVLRADMLDGTVVLLMR